MKTIRINTTDYQYDVLVGDVLLELKKYIGNHHEILVITDENVYNYHFPKLTDVIPLQHVFILSKTPEQDKSISMFEKCVNYAISNFLDRNLLVIAFGGGAVGDFAAFFASTYKRGVRFINLPTTLLAHDSAIGGKTALNVGNIKNVVGTFYQPEVVIYHTPFLETLSLVEVKNGFGEILKHDLLSIGSLFFKLLDSELKLNKLLDDKELLEEFIYQAILVKKHYIESDPYETKGIREYLNFGHTLGHALELLYQLKHGIAVSIGIGFDLFLADSPYTSTYFNLIKRLEILTANNDFSVDLISEILKNDKKNRNGLITFIGLQDFGKPYRLELAIEEFKHNFREFMRLYL